MIRGRRDGYDDECRERRRWRREEAEVRIARGVGVDMKPVEPEGREEVRRQVRIGGVSWCS